MEAQPSVVFMQPPAVTVGGLVAKFNRMFPPTCHHLFSWAKSVGPNNTKAINSPSVLIVISLAMM